MTDLQTALTDRDILIKRVVDLQAECERLKGDNIAHGRVNLLLARQNADLRDVLSDIVTEAGIPASLESRVTAALDIHAAPHRWYGKYRAEVEAGCAACGSEVARAAV